MNDCTPLTIKCPHCGAEYLPSEIYIPDDFLPECDDVVRDEEGKLMACHQAGMNLKEEYECDYCGHRFSVEAKVSFTSSENSLHDYGFDYETKLYPEDRMELSEK